MCTHHTSVCVPLQALEAKEKGNAAYKKKDFAAALEHYEKATQLDPTNITFYSNRAGTAVTQQIKAGDALGFWNASALHM